MKKTIAKSISSAVAAVVFVVAMVVVGICGAAYARAGAPSVKEKSPFFRFEPITESEFRKAAANNFNAPFETEIATPGKIVKAYAAIAETYDDNDFEVAKSMDCETPRCITEFKAYYPALGLFLFTISDYNFDRACFSNAATSELLSDGERYRGDFGVMSKLGLWAALERGDSDSFLRIEISKVSADGVSLLVNFDFAPLDINEGEDTAMFWAGPATLYVATSEYGAPDSEPISRFYALKFGE